MSSRAAWERVAAIALFYLALSIALTWPIALHLGDALPSSGDSLSHAWTLAWMIHALTTDPANLWNGNIFHPYPNAVAFGSPLVIQSILGAPILLATGNTPLTFNLLVVASFVLSGITAHALAYHHTRHHTAGLLSGVVFAFCGYRFAHAHQLESGATQWLPLAFLTLDRLVERASVGRAVALAASVVLTALSNWYYAYMLVPLLAIYLVARLLVGRPPLPVLRRVAGSLVLATVLAAAALVPFALPYTWVQSELGFKRSVENVASFSANLSDYLLPHPDSLFWQPLYRFVQSAFGSRDTEHVLFPGFVAAVLATIGVFAWRPESTVGSSAAGGNGAKSWSPMLGMAIGAFILSLGPLLRTPLLQRVASADVLPLPYLLLHQYVPGFDGMRVIARFGVFINLAVAILAAYGVAGIARALEQRPLNAAKRIASTFGAPWSMVLCARGVGAAAIGLVIVESVTPTFPIWPIAATAEQAPPVYRWLARQEPEAVIVELPMVDASSQYDRYIPAYLYYSTFHWRRLVNGQLTFYPPGFFDIVAEMQRFPSEPGVSLLQGLSVHYAVVHTGRLPEAAMTRWSASGWSWPGLERVATFDDDIVYRVLPVASAASLDGLAARVRPGRHLMAQAGAPATVEVLNEGPAYFVGAPASRIRVAACWTSPEAGIEAVAVEARAPLIVPPHGSRPGVIRSLSSRPAAAEECRAVGEASLGNTPVPVQSIEPLVAGEGWFALEDSPLGPMRWMGPQATLVVTAHQDTPALLQFVAESFARERTLELSLNDRRLETFRIGTPPSWVRARLTLRPGRNVFTLRSLEGAESPRSLGRGADSRSLSVSLRDLAVLLDHP